MAKVDDNFFPKVILDMQTANPAAPSDRSWKVYSKADGIYAESSNAVVGPFGAAGASLSFGSNAMAVGATNQAGTTGTYIGSDHRHLGIHTITSSTSNTLARPTLNLRAGANIGLAASDSDGDGVFDTVTIVGAASSGGGATSIPGWMSWFVGTTDANNYYWTGSDLSGFTTQTVTGSATWLESGNAILVSASNQTADDCAAQLISKTISTGDSWLVAVNSTFLASDVGNSTAGVRMLGVCMTDGTTTSANFVGAHIQLDDGAGSPVQNLILVGRHGTLTNNNTGAPWVSQVQMAGVGGWIFIKLKYSAANTFQMSAGPSPYQLSAFGEADISKTMTPTNVGLWISTANAGTALGMFGPLKKV